MGPFVLPAYLRWSGWASIIIIAVIVVGMLATIFI